ncbi:hypothetical protein V565_111350 [Rhizoctonia solani 123E]|uniref:Uncharacterized protein n=1 Tax=Rhizoctonia solani 123E TaxID=1423351 RepID=A0A074RQ08_9AGAM|nr:hypothetical protein V565_111350 [Rhizoctonia solani 123E]
MQKEPRRLKKSYNNIKKKGKNSHTNRPLAIHNRTQCPRRNRNRDEPKISRKLSKGEVVGYWWMWMALLWAERWALGRFRRSYCVPSRRDSCRCDRRPQVPRSQLLNRMNAPSWVVQPTKKGMAG